MRELLENILLLQPDWDSTNTPAMAERGRLVRRDVAGWLRERVPALSAELPVAVNDLQVEGRDGTGRKTEIPWVRIHSASRSSSATEGWYVVYLFAANGEHVYLSLNQGTTRWENGEFRPRSAVELTQRVTWARNTLSYELGSRSDLLEDIALEARGSPLGPAYERGNVAAFAYALDNIPSSVELEKDLQFLTRVLGNLYLATDRALMLPGEPVPEIADAFTAAEHSAGRRKGRGFRLTVSERQAIEQRAMHVASDHLIAQCYKVKNVSATRPYDIDAQKGQERLFVEVKGTTSIGSEVILTKGEVELNAREYPFTVLMVVSAITLDREPVPPVASGGVLRVVKPWRIKNQDLTPIAYTYSLPHDAPEVTP